MPGNSRPRYFCIAALAAFVLATGATAAPGILPLRTTATFSAHTRGKSWSEPVKLADGRTAYFLSLEPDYDVGHHVVTVELVLRRPRGKGDSSNLLDATERAHGLQSYDFAADDLARGARMSADGENRVVSLKNLKLVVRISITNAGVSPISEGKHQIEELELQIEVDNYNPSIEHPVTPQRANGHP